MTVSLKCRFLTTVFHVKICQRIKFDGSTMSVMNTTFCHIKICLRIKFDGSTVTVSLNVGF